MQGPGRIEKCKVAFPIMRVFSNSQGQSNSISKNMALPARQDKKEFNAILP